eukprot:3940493-Rhodomonas_salina.2
MEVRYGASKRCIAYAPGSSIRWVSTGLRVARAYGATHPYHTPGQYRALRSSHHARRRVGQEARVVGSQEYEATAARSSIRQVSTGLRVAGA